MGKLSSQLNLISELLELSDIEVAEVKLQNDHSILIRVKSTSSKILCHKCNRLCEAYGYGRTLKLRHLPILGKKTYIEITPPRGICKHCNDNPTTTQTLDWFDRNAHHTKVYEKNVLLSLVHSTIADVSIKEDLSETTIQRIVDEYISDIMNWKQIKNLGIIGIDEISLKKGYQDYVTIITSRMDNEIKILAVIKGREKSTIKAYFDSIPKKKRKTIIAICCDLYDGYIKAAKEVFGESVIVVTDRFHVAKLYRKSLVTLRKKELSRLRKELSEKEYHSLKSAISILVKKQECYNKEDKKELEKLFNYSPLLKVAYRLTRQLTSLFNTHYRKATAKNKIQIWISTVQASDIHCFDKFIVTLEKYTDEIVNYFVNRNTSGFVEGLNNKIKILKRRCYGIFNITHLFQRIFLDLEGYKLFNINQSVIVIS